MKVLKMMVAVAILVMATMASAEQFSTRTVEIPFSFTVGEHTLPAGQYQVRMEGKSLILTNSSGDTTVALSHSVQSNQPAEQSRLEFVNNGGSYYLYHVWRAGETSGLELSLAKANRKVADQNTGKQKIAVRL